MISSGGLPGFDPAYLLVAIVVAPALAFGFLAFAWMAGVEMREKVIARLTTAVSLLSTALSAWLGWSMIFAGLPSVRFVEGLWFQVGNYQFPLVLTADRLSMPLIALTTVLVGLVGTFSVRYLHREKGFLRFFLLLHVFSFGMVLLLAAGSFDLLLGGWELVGITSVLLIAFFHERQGPVRGAVHVFSMYKIGDLGLLLGIFVLYSAMGTSEWARLMPGEWPSQTSALPAHTATVAALLFLFAAAAKSAQVPFSGWLPRAMAGPTPSSAIFYGALAIHAGAYLLLRIEPMLVQSRVAVVAVIALGALGALMGTLAHRVATDAKSSIAYAAMTQLGVIFIEIALGFPRLALAHMIGHAIVRTLQFLRAPSMLHDYHRVHAAAGGHLGRTGQHYVAVVPSGARLWLYRFALDRGFSDAALERFVTKPVLLVSNWLASFEPKPVKSSDQAEPARIPAPAEKWAEREV